eukprot:m.311823 g.311823  ORF g.311823 m.311823 type:complete len:68 (+) comp15961_c6_seq1:1977-2180(+)
MQIQHDLFVVTYDPALEKHNTTGALLLAQFSSCYFIVLCPMARCISVLCTPILLQTIWFICPGSTLF